MSSVSRAHTELVRQLSLRAVQDPQAYHEMALRTRSPEVLDAVAVLALPGSQAKALQEIGRSVAEGLSVSALADLQPDPLWLSELASLIAVQVTEHTPDLLSAWGLWTWAASFEGDQLSPSHRDLRAQVAWTLEGEHRDQLTAWVDQDGLLGPQVRAELRADLANPWFTEPQAASDSTWQDRCQDLLGPDLATITVQAGQGLPFDRLETMTTQPSLGDRSIAIIMTTYRPDASLLTAIRSVIGQTWQEWTLLLVDDASGPEYEDLLVAAAASDDRIRLLRRDHNGGTYQARNTALREVGSADFITFHDSDDWSHPQRLELTVEPLRSNPTLVASTAWALKATDDLQITRLGYRGKSRMAASLLVRRDPVATELGFFDPVRKSADKEFQRRIGAAFPDGLAEITDPIAIIRRGHSSLSSADHSRGWRHHSRRHYQQAYQPWHRRIRQGKATAYLNDAEQRTLWAPARWHDPDPAVSQRPARYDVVLAADYSSPDADERFDPVIARARRQGRQVGLLQLDGPVLHSSPEPPTSATIVRRVTRGHVNWVYLDDEIDVGQVVVLDPGVLHPGTDMRAEWSCQRVDVALPSGNSPNPPATDLRRVSWRARHVFGVASRWWDPTTTSWPEEGREGPD